MWFATARSATMRQWNKKQHSQPKNPSPQSGRKYRRKSLVKFLRTSFPLYFGTIAYEGAPDVIDSIVAQMPEGFRPFIKDLANRAYAEYAQALYGTATPPRATEATNR